MKKVAKQACILLLILLILSAVLVLILFIRQSLINQKINNDFSEIYSDSKYQTPVSVDGIEVIQQKVSCGYACIELLARWQGRDITEQVLLEQNGGKITTSMGNGFVNEMNKQFPEHVTTRHSNLTNSELLKKVYESLEAGTPVPVELAALYQQDAKRVWTLHFALITAMDVVNDSITISNPYGYTESYTLNDFLRATRYDSYRDMEFYLKLGFAAGVFNKNTVYIIQ